jgi:hypothetical protein
MMRCRHGEDERRKGESHGNRCVGQLTRALNYNSFSHVDRLPFVVAGCAGAGKHRRASHFLPHMFSEAAYEIRKS